MEIKRFRWRQHAGRFGRALAAATAIVCAGFLPSVAGHAQSGSYSMNWSSITAGGIVQLRSSCYVLSGSIGFVSAPGILSGISPYTLYTGFWVAAPIAGRDEIFFNGFEECN